MFNKSLTTNLVALVIIVIGYTSPVYSEIICMTGLFALSGSVTNWLAIHMLFEKVPFFYGSGVIPSRFKEFKLGIKQLVMNEFFTPENIETFMGKQSEAFATDMKDAIDFDRVFAGLVEAIEGSPMGSMLGMLGGKKALEPLKEPVTLKLQEIMLEMKDTASAASEEKSLTSSLLFRVEQIVDQRLDELTPVQVKNIIQEMIRKHLGWLVVWGGAVGGFIGLGVSIIQ
ncbi:DUF445 domain-containing protein [Alphaproteobacteria bacterium]|nr:DUF445 domain-containing protein [Alphaproteobacteria bacterium]